MESNQKVYLLFVGPDEADVTVDAELIAWAQSNSRVIFAGFTKVVEQYLSAMDVYILPSYREGFGMGVVEAEAMGVPVIVTRIPGPIDAMLENESGLVIEKKSTEQLQSAMEQMLSADLEAMSQAGLKYATEGFEQQEFFKKVLEDRKRLMQ